MVRFKLPDQDEVFERRTLLVRMEPTATYPPHRRAVQQSSAWCSKETCALGNWSFGLVIDICAPPESIHPESHTQDGCLLLIISSLHDEALA